MSVVVIDYGSGNLRSVAKAVSRAALDAGLTTEVVVSADPKVVRRASRVILPGVGAFADCAAGLAALAGMREALQDSVFEAGCPFLGICVGMQLMADRGREHGDHAGFGWLAGEVTALHPGDPAMKVPHMGWNQLIVKAPHPLLAGIPAGAHAYFVHSYYFRPTRATVVQAETRYGHAIAAVVAKDNMAGTQFHPEKSQAVGLKVISNFLTWQP
jgi:glutamine amidotransferase